MRANRFLFRLLGVLPPALGSWLGACGGLFAPRLMPQRAARAARNLAVLQPAISRSARVRLLRRRWRNMGRFMFEYPALHRLARSSRISIRDPNGFERIMAEARPLILVSIHVGNWELLYAHLHAAGRRNWLGIYLPPDDPDQAELLAQARCDYLSASIAPGGGAAAIINKHLQQPSAGLYMLLDGLSDKQVSFPTFGRGFAHRDNLSVALRLALGRGALIVPVYLVRTGGCRFELVWQPPLDIVLADRPTAATALDAFFGPLAVSHADQWLALQDIRLSPA